MPPRLLVAREAAGRQQLVSVDLRTGARRTVHLPELRPGRRRLAELVPLAGGAVAGVVADDAEWSQASNEIPPEPRVYAWTTGDFGRPGRRPAARAGHHHRRGRQAGRLRQLLRA